MNRDMIAAAALVLIATVAGAVVLVQRHRQPVSTPVQPTPQVQFESPEPDAPPSTAPAIALAPQRADAPVAPAPPPPGRARRGNVRPRPPAANTVIDEPAARDALSRIGADPAADVVWIAAINDNSFTPSQRRNLIEDLNEAGFADPRNLTPEDLPAIEYRLALIEQIAADAMDDVNAAAFEEAYKDLVNMRARVAQR